MDQVGIQIQVVFDVMAVYQGVMGLIHGRESLPNDELKEFKNTNKINQKGWRDASEVKGTVYSFRSPEFNF